MKLVKLLGSRVVKTGIAVFLTATICMALGWPPVFAVITAIVTLEPTVADSIKKGLVRFPASVIGSGYAVLFIALFGSTPITYTLAAVFTIVTCFKLNLHAGLLVATLTAVTMVEIVDGNYIATFFTRLGTTSVGLLVSTGVNMFILPANYREDIAGKIEVIRMQMGNTLHEIFSVIVKSEQSSKLEVDRDLRLLSQKINNTETLIRFQNDEAKYHPLVGKEKMLFSEAEEQLAWLKMIYYHLDNVHQMPSYEVSWGEHERDLILSAVRDLKEGLQNNTYIIDEDHEQQLKQLTKIFLDSNESVIKQMDIHSTTFPPKLIVLYELVTIYQLVNQFYTKKLN